MVELENKLELFRQMIWGEAKQESERALYESTETTTALLEKRKAELAERAQEYVQRRVHLAQVRRNEAIALQKEENKRRALEERQVFLEQVMAALQEEFRSYTATEAYRQWMDSALEGDLSAHPKASVSVRAEDLTWVQARHPQAVCSVMSEEELGGYLLVSEDGRRRIRHTLQVRLEQNAYAIGKALYELLEEGRTWKK